jgi:hypothetical protein
LAVASFGSVDGVPKEWCDDERLDDDREELRCDGLYAGIGTCYYRSISVYPPSLPPLPLSLELSVGDQRYVQSFIEIGLGMISTHL